MKFIKRGVRRRAREVLGNKIIDSVFLGVPRTVKGSPKNKKTVPADSLWRTA